MRMFSKCFSDYKFIGEWEDAEKAHQISLALLLDLFGFMIEGRDGGDGCADCVSRDFGL
jgi:hypothetical protein